MWGNLQYSDGPRMYGVKKSLFYYQPDQLAELSRTSQATGRRGRPGTSQQADAVDRAYDYPHVVAAYWSMYRLARNYPGLVTAHPWEWYLDKAFNTVKYMTGGFAPPGGRGGVGYVNVGLMDGDIFVMLLDDLKREGWSEQSAYLEAAMKRRADRWNADAYPFGSEMAWDSTGQEEIFAWTELLRLQGQGARVARLDPRLHADGAALGLQRQRAPLLGLLLRRARRAARPSGRFITTVPASTRSRCSRSIREHPDDFYLLRIGYGGSMGALTNIDQEGFPSAAFHSYPQNLRWDDYTGDYGPNFFGHAVTTGTYVVNHPTTAGRRSAGT